MNLLLDDLWDGVRAQPGRAGTSFAAVAVATGALSLLLAVLNGLEDKSRRLSDELGADVAAVMQPPGLGPNSGERLRVRHARFLAANLPDWEFSTVSVFEAPTLGSGNSVSVVATEGSLIHIRRWRLVAGRFLDHPDIRDRRRNAVVSESLSERLNWRVGDIILLRGVPFDVVGAVRLGGDTVGAQAGGPGLALGERVVFVPRTAAPFSTPDVPGEASAVDAIFMKAPSGDDFARAVGSARALLGQNARLKAVSWVTPQSLVEGIQRLQRHLAWTIGGLVALCLVSSGATLMGLMLANVRDRVTEIGLRRSLGATPADIASLFLAEACAIAGVAAAAGTGAANAGLALVGHRLPVPLHLGLSSALTPIVVSLGIGIAFSVCPARRAAAIAPAEALRNE